MLLSPLPFIFVILSVWFENGVIYRHIYNLIAKKRKKKRTFQSHILFYSLIDFVDSLPFITDKRREEDEKSCSHTHNWRERVRSYIDTLSPGFPFHLIYYFAQRTNKSVIFSLLDDISTWKMILMLRSIFFFSCSLLILCKVPLKLGIFLRSNQQRVFAIALIYLFRFSIRSSIRISHFQ